MKKPLAERTLIMRSILLAVLFSAAGLSAADILKVHPVNPARSVTAEDPIRFELELDEPADSARVDFVVPWCKPVQKLQINGAYHVDLEPMGDDKKHFQAELTIKDYYGDGYVVDTRVPAAPGDFAFEPVLMRNGRESRLPAVKSAFAVDIGNRVSPINQPLVADGKFGQALSFDGEKSIAVIPQFKFCPDKGTIDVLVFLPMMMAKEEGLVFFIQSVGEEKWTYQALGILPSSRKLQYYTWDGSRVHKIVSKELPDENWVKVTVTFDLAAKQMELFINGESQGTEEYDTPCGGKKSRIEMGGRFHAGKELTQLGQMLVDEFRISEVVRDGKAIESAPFATDGNTLMLLHFDNPSPLKDDSGK